MNVGASGCWTRDLGGAGSDDSVAAGNFIDRDFTFPAADFDGIVDGDIDGAVEDGEVVGGVWVAVEYSGEGFTGLEAEDGGSFSGDGFADFDADGKVGGDFGSDSSLDLGGDLDLKDILLILTIILAQSQIFETRKQMTSGFNFAQWCLRLFFDFEIGS
ncbi:bifunctional purine biosynthesis protein PurH [Striga asiatica]|uniref:Bifunctional purine biosynthesis protein PurH n=1 Tax=Striga asiatica TaxID=4170 RepID=A0A5A7PHC0_STRAF|nr:bifunctional purine biosynthesis protein PurH [Striga asiatica]